MSSTYLKDGDIWLKIPGLDTRNQGIYAGEYHVRLGSGGAICSLKSKDKDDELLFLDFKKNTTNIATRALEINKTSVYIYNTIPSNSVVNLETHISSREPISGGYTECLRYDLKEPGVIDIMRILKPIPVNGVIADADADETYFSNNISSSCAEKGEWCVAATPLFEAGNSLNHKLFNQIAIILNVQNASSYSYVCYDAWSPSQSASQSKSILSYKNNAHMYNNTGFFMAFCRGREENQNKDRIALISGKKQLEMFGYASEEPRPTLVSLNHDIRLLPSIRINNWNESGILVINYKLLFNQGLSSKYAKKIHESVETIPGPQFYYDSSFICGTRKDVDLKEIIRKMDISTNLQPHYIDKLEQLIGSDNEFNEFNKLKHSSLNIYKLNQQIKSDIENELKRKRNINITDIVVESETETEKSYEISDDFDDLERDYLYLDYQERLSPFGQLEQICYQQAQKLKEFAIRWWKGGDAPSRGDDSDTALSLVSPIPQIRN